MATKQILPQARVLAYYLPQFHPIPENDEWWGKGFTEWTNVGKAKPLFPGHYQPHVPADLGYYDLRVPETREAQAEMAREAGIEGFVYWHYWFGNGKRLLERPFNEVLASGKPDFPFALAWANESWSGTFHGKVKGGTLIEQCYGGDKDYYDHFMTVLPAFKDKRYITIDGKPIFVVYKPKLIPNAEHFIKYWRQLATENGLPGIYFIGIANVRYDKLDSVETLKQYMQMGFDGMTTINMFNQGEGFWYKVKKHIWMKWLHKPDIRKYDFELMKDKTDAIENVFPTVYPNWDHTPRSGYKGICVADTSPTKWKRALEMMLDRIENKPADKRILFVKSWNEWAEGNYLEPDIKYGHAYLDNLQEALFEK
jgi:hypothetical protein